MRIFRRYVPVSCLALIQLDAGCKVEEAAVWSEESGTAWCTGAHQLLPIRLEDKFLGALLLTKKETRQQ